MNRRIQHPAIGIQAFTPALPVILSHSGPECVQGKATGCVALKTLARSLGAARREAFGVRRIPSLWIEG